MNDDLTNMSPLDLLQEVKKLREAIRKHMLEKGNQRCHLSDHELYEALPEGDQSETNLGSEQAFLANCQRFYRNRQASFPGFSEEVLDCTANLSRKWEEGLLEGAKKFAEIEDRDLTVEHIKDFLSFYN